MQIGELANKTGVSTRSIRHYEKKQLIASTRKRNGYRDFDESAVERIKTIQLYLSLGLTTGQIEDILTCVDQSDTSSWNHAFSCADLLAMYEQRLSEINEHLDALITVKHRVEKQIHRLQSSILIK